MVLIPEVVDAVGPDVPVLAAGGIATGRQMTAALALGAQGVWTGSQWLTVAEANTSPVIMERLLAATSRDTVRSRAYTGKPARQLRSAWTEAFDDPEGPGTLPMPLQGILHQEAARRFIAREQQGAHRLPRRSDRRTPQRGAPDEGRDLRHGRGMDRHDASASTHCSASRVGFPGCSVLSRVLL